MSTMGFQTMELSLYILYIRWDFIKKISVANLAAHSSEDAVCLFYAIYHIHIWVIGGNSRKYIS